MILDIQKVYDGHPDSIQDNLLYQTSGVTCDAFGSFLDDEYFEVMQFTGLKDKNGKEIFEGDIVDWPNYEGVQLYIVEFKEGRFGLNLSRGGFGLTNPICSDCEVIGNKFENPEL